MKDWINILQQKSSEGREIKESEIIINIPPELHNDWDTFMRGKTCPILDDGDYGVFSWDLINFLKKFNDQ
jgi:hypothetical protein